MVVGTEIFTTLSKNAISFTTSLIVYCTLKGGVPEVTVKVILGEVDPWHTVVVPLIETVTVGQVVVKLT